MSDEKEEEEEEVREAVMITSDSGEEMLGSKPKNRDDEPGPSGIHYQRSSNSLILDDEHDLEIVLAEVESSSTLQLNPEMPIVKNDSATSMNELNTLLAISDAFRETLQNLIRRVTLAISKNREAQKLLKAKLRQAMERGLRINVKKVPISRFMFPYFRDSHEMEPPKNREYELKVIRREYDPLVKEEKKWCVKECQMLTDAVRKSLVEKRIQSFVQKKEMYAEKIRASGSETTAVQMNEWKDAVAEMERLIAYHKNLPDNELLIGDYSDVDWAKIAKVDFLGNRTPRQVRLKWINELCPRWSKEPWSPVEIQRLRECAGRWNNWHVIAERLGTNRTAFQCFVKFRSELEIDNVGRSWTKEEDAHLMTLAHCMQVNGKMQWEKIAHHMEERSRQQCTIRYRRALDTNIRFGRWEVNEDLLLTCAVSRFGTKDWIKVASCVPGRSDSQCRDRWVNVLDKSIKIEPWTVDEDEKLLEGIKIFGKGEWSRISTMLPGRSASHCKSRFRSLVSAKVKLASECQIYPFRRFNWRGKRRREQVEAAFRRLLAADGEGGLAEQVMNSFNMRALSVDEMEALSAMEPSQRITVMQFLNELREKHLNTGIRDKRSIWELLSDKLQFEISYLDSSTQNALLKYYKKFLGGSAFDLLTLAEKAEFDEIYKVLQQSDPKAARDHLINGLCDLIERNDNSAHSRHQKRFCRDEILDEIDRYLSSVLISDVNKAVHSGSDAFTIPPCIGTVHLYEHIEEQIHMMRGLVKEFFEQLTDEDDSLLLQLSPQVTLDPEYILLKKKMRTLLFWPMLLYHAIENKEPAERRLRLRAVAARKMVLHQELFLARVQSIVGTDEEMRAAPSDDIAEQSVGQYLRERIYKRRRFRSNRKTDEVIQDSTVDDRNMQEIEQRIDDCIETVCAAVQRIYERDFVIPAAYKYAVGQAKRNSSGRSTNSERDEVKKALNTVIDKVARAETSGTLSIGSVKRTDMKGPAKKGSASGSHFLSSTAETVSRKRKSPTSCGGEVVNKPKKARKQETKKLVEKDREAGEAIMGTRGKREEEEIVRPSAGAAESTSTRELSSTSSAGARNAMISEEVVDID